MKNRFIQMFLVICAVMLMICAVSVWAAAENAIATPTDLAPVEQEESVPETTEPEITEPEKTEPETTDPEETVPAETEPEEAEPDASESEKAEPQAAESETTEPENADPEETIEEDTADSVEIIITKAVRIGDSWSGTMKKTKPAVLKLDVERAQQVNLLVQGKHGWITVEKSDRLSDNPARTLTNDETSQTVISWYAEAGSYLITLGPVEPNLMAKLNVSVMNATGYENWMKEQAEQQEEQQEEADEEIPEEGNDIESTEAEEPEEQPDNETPDEMTEIEEEPGEEEDATELDEYSENPEAEINEAPEDDGDPEEPEMTEAEDEDTEEETVQNRSIEISVTCDSPNPVVGDTAHFEAKLYGYEELTYSIQWQYSPDHKNWFDIADATELRMDVVTDDENNLYYWRVLIYVEEDVAE